MSAPRVGVVGHVELVEFCVAARLPLPGEILHPREHFVEAAGGGGVAAVQMARLVGSVEFFTAVGDDEQGARAAARLRELGVTVHCTAHERPQRRAFTYLTDDHERTITILGDRLVPLGGDRLPWERVCELDGVYLTGGDLGAVRAAREARVLVATPRAAPALVAAGVRLDAVVMSATDAHEQGIAEQLDPPPALVVRTMGGEGGEWQAEEGRTGTWKAVAPPGPPVDAYGAGDSFAAGLTVALAAGLDVERALEYAARCGATCLSGRGPYGASLGAVGPPV